MYGHTVVPFKRVSFRHPYDVFCHKLTASQLTVPQKQGPPAKWTFVRDPTTECQICSEITNRYIFLYSSPFV
jgi:hypothetical protein